MPTRHKIYSKFLIAAVFLWATTLFSAEYLLDAGNAKNWIFFNGSEFKGATGGVFDSGNGMKLKYDFSKGGAYVGIRPDKFSIPQAESYIISAYSDQNVTMTYRMIDSNNRYFQSAGVPLKAGENKDLTFSPNGPWQSNWGGDANIKKFTLPIKSIWIMVSKKNGDPLEGAVLLRNFRAVKEQIPVEALSRENFTIKSNSWSIEGTWLPQIDGALLKIDAKATGSSPAELAIEMPNAARNIVQRYQLNSAETMQPLLYRPPFIDGKVNPNNIYTIKLSVSEENGTSKTEKMVLLCGSKSSNVNLGFYNPEKKVRHPKLGTCVHFSYAPNPSGAFKGWHLVDKLLPEIADAGFKYIREGVQILSDKNGNFEISKYDISTLKKAQKLGIEQILIISMDPNDTKDIWLKKVKAVVRDTRDYVKIYELGNEPHNFGWSKKYKGSWNGYEKDGSISLWLKEHTKATNVAADLIKEIYPEATVIGLGSNSPTNFHALNLGVSKNLDGVVDHPYTYSLPSEKIPFGHNLTKRDGIEVGDKEHTFAGLIKSYHEHFIKTGKSRSIWATEYGFSTFFFNGNNEKGLYTGFTYEAQSAYLARRTIESLALPIAVTCQYDFLDDYGSKSDINEANFGLLRADYSRKPAFYVLRRINSLFEYAQPDNSAKLTLKAAPLHRNAIRGTLTKWDGEAINASNGVRMYAFNDPNNSQEKMMAIWSMQPYSREFNNRAVTFEIENWAEYSEIPVGINLLTGETFDIPLKVENGKLIVENFSLKDAPILIKFFKK